MAPSRDVLLTGSVPLRPSEKVFETVARHLGGVAPRIPDGEQIGWSSAARRTFERHPALEAYRQVPLKCDLFAQSQDRRSCTDSVKERDALGVTEFALYCARTGFLQRNRAALGDFFEDMVRATRWMLAPVNRAEATHLLAEVTKQSPEVLATYYLLPGEDVYRDPDARPDVEALQHNLDAMEELGFIHSRIDVAKHTDLSF